MTVGPGPTSTTVSAFALRLLAVRGTAAYAVLVAPENQIPDIVTELYEELVAFDPDLKAAVLHQATTGESLIRYLDHANEVLLVDAASYDEQDWALLDRRRSSLTHDGVLVFVMTGDNFDGLMRSAPNLASWLGSLVFRRNDEAAELASMRDRRLDALRSWARRTDREVIQDAIRGALPADPEYAEWLVLLGRGDLLDGRGP